MINAKVPNSKAPNSKKDLQHITPRFHVVDIDQQLFLIAKDTGEVQIINDVARLFIELAELGCSNDQIIEDVCQALTVEKDQVTRDLQAFCSQLETLSGALNTSLELKSLDDKNLLPLESFELCEPQTPLTYRYSIYKLYIDVTYPSPEVSQVSHAILSPMAVEAENDNGGNNNCPVFSIVIETGAEGYLIQLDSEPIYYVDSLDLVPNYLRTTLLNLAGAEIDNWLSIHAAAISDKTGQATLFAAPSGSGKSTLSLDLCGQGANYLGDDMLMIDLDQKRLIPFTTSINLKPGSWALFSERYSDLLDIPTLQEKTRPVKYFPLKPKERKPSFDIKNLVFPTYNENGKNTLEPLEIDQVIHLLAESGCYSKVEASVSMSKKYLEFFLGLNAYKLAYRSSEDAIRLLKDKRILDL